MGENMARIDRLLKKAEALRPETLEQYDYEKLSTEELKEILRLAEVGSEEAKARIMEIVEPVRRW